MRYGTWEVQLGAAAAGRRVLTALLGAALACALATAPAEAARKAPSLQRAFEPVAMTGAELERLLGTLPAHLVAYRYRPPARKGKRRVSPGKRGGWVQVPVQVDERALTDFGGNPFAGSPTGERTVYGTAPVGASVLQYTDPRTFVGADPDPTLDRDDEVVFMAGDAGPRAPAQRRRPNWVMRKGATRVALRNPVNGARAWIYLFRAGAGPKPGRPRRDYVNYEFELLSGNYKQTYDWADGPNPETSTARTASYRVGFSDRWYFDSLRIDAGRASGAEILDGYKFGYALGSCGRSEATFNDGEGAFVVNKDGPVRAIRSYVGANSGPYTQRTHYLYGRRHEIVTDLRVHAGLPGLFTHYDLSAAGMGMTYRNSANRAGVAVDGVADAISDEIAGWHLWSGAQGSLLVAERFESSFEDAIAAGTTTGFYQDDDETPIQQCWGDDDLLGSAGLRIVPQGGVPNTDPTLGSAESLRGTSVNLIEPPGASAADADLRLRRLRVPLRTKTFPFRR